MLKKTVTGLLWMLLLIPLVLLARWAHPSADDYCYAVSAGTGFWKMQTSFYMSWSGRYTATAIFWPLLLDGSFWFYRFMEILALALIAAGLLYFSSSFPGFKNRTDRALFSVAFLFLFFDRATELSDTIFWVNGVVPYMLPIPAILVVWKQIREPGIRRRRAALLAFVAFLIAGLSESAPLFLFLVLALAFLEAFSLPADQRRNRMRAILLIGAVTLVGFVILFAAPGNRNRASNFQHKFELAHAIKGTLTVSLFVLRKWVRYSPLLPASVIFLLWLRHRSSEESRPLLSGISAWLLPLSLIAVYILALFPVLFSTGMPPSGRSGNLLFFFFLIFWFGNLYALQPYLHRIPAATIWLLFAVLLLTTRWSEGNYGKGLIPDLAGKAAEYDRQMMYRYSLIRDPQNPNPVVPRLTVQPMTVFHDDIVEDPTDWRNSCEADYYGKKSVRLAPE